MTTEAMIETVRKAFADGATDADKQAGAQTLRIALQVLDAKPGQPLGGGAPAPAQAAPAPVAQPQQVEPDVLDMLIDRFMAQLAPKDQDRIRGTVAEDMIPMVQLPY